MIEVKRGDVVHVRFDPVVGREIGKTRPAVVIQNDVGNRVAPTTIVAALTAYSAKKAEYPFCVTIATGEAGIRKRSVVNCAHIRTVDRSRIRKRLGELDAVTMDAVDEALRVSLSLP